MMDVTVPVESDSASSPTTGYGETTGIEDGSASSLTTDYGETTDVGDEVCFGAVSSFAATQSEHH
jgi:hypothetical protein